MIFRTRQRTAPGRSRARYRQVTDKLVLPAGRNLLARRGPAYKDRTVPDRQRCDWRRGWRRNGHRRRPAWGRRENRAHARRKSCPRAKAALAVGTRPLLTCAGSHRAAQNRATASASMVKGLGKTGQSLRQRTASKMRTQFPIVSTRHPPPRRNLAAAPEMSLKLGRPLGAIGLGARQMDALQAHRFTKRSMSSSAVANEVASRMRTLFAPASKFSLLRT